MKLLNFKDLKNFQTIEEFFYSWCGTEAEDCGGVNKDSNIMLDKWLDDVMGV